MDQYFNVLKTTYEHYCPYLEKDDSGIRLIDPVDEKVIGFHYGETHIGGAYILGGIKYKNENLVQTGVDILKSFMAHAKEFELNPAYHWDFNNFALCVVYEYLEKYDKLPKFREQIKSFILIQQDSNNATINWHPMRIYVNTWKHRWTNDSKYKKLVESLSKRIVEAQYEDGFIEDLLPKGTSFNFQYHMFTTALIAFLKRRSIDIANLDKAISRAIDMMDAEGDVNYLGRGNNQIFAWGPAIYLYNLASSDAHSRAWNYISKRSLIAIKNDNLIVNEFNGRDKVWWWDYHFCSVYIAHYVFWLMLTALDNEKIDWKYIQNESSDSGIHIYNGKYFIVSFDGRKHYLAESGRVISNISCSGKTFFKGAFGPYYKEYGFKYSSPIDSLHNFIGIIQTGTSLGKYTEKIVYPESIQVEDGKIIFKYKKPQKGIVNVAWFDELAPRIISGNMPVKLRENCIFKGPYGWVHLFQSKELLTDTIEIAFGE